MRKKVNEIFDKAEVITKTRTDFFKSEMYFILDGYPLFEAKVDNFTHDNGIQSGNIGIDFRVTEMVSPGIRYKNNYCKVIGNIFDTVTEVFNERYGFNLDPDNAPFDVDYHAEYFKEKLCE